MATQAPETKNMQLVSHHDLDGFGNIGEGVALHRTSDGRRIYYMAHESGPKDFTSVDVTDIKNPKLVTQTELPHSHLRSNSLAIVGDTMLVAYQAAEHGLPGSGMRSYDISDPNNVRHIGTYDAAGPHSKGCHCLWWADGEYAHLATGTPDSNPVNAKDDQFYVILDVKDPSNPKEAGRWWFPGTQVGDQAPPPPRHPRFDMGHSVHNANVYPERLDRAYCGWKDSGVVILDIADKSNPRMVSNVCFSPPFPGFVHTVMPLFQRDLLVVSQEANRQHGEDHPKLVWMMDNSLETNPVIISTLPMADTSDFFNRPGRYGAHNIYENTPGDTSYFSDTLVYATFFNGGIRVFDIKDPFRPEEVAYFVPPVPEGTDANGINDIHVDENGILYVTDRLKGGLYILELTV
jgi:hypothetical protein